MIQKLEIANESRKVRAADPISFISKEVMVQPRHLPEYFKTIVAITHAYM